MILSEQTSGPLAPVNWHVRQHENNKSQNSGQAVVSPLNGRCSSFGNFIVVLEPVAEADCPDIDGGEYNGSLTDVFLKLGK